MRIEEKKCLLEKSIKWNQLNSPVSIRSNGPRWADSTTAVTMSTARWSHSSAAGPLPNPSRRSTGSVRYHKARSPVLPTRVLLRLNRLRLNFVRFILVFHPRVFSSPFTRHNLQPAFVVVFLEISTQLFNENTACNARRNDFSLFVFLAWFSDYFGTKLSRRTENLIPTVRTFYFPSVGLDGVHGQPGRFEHASTTLLWFVCCFKL